MDFKTLMSALFGFSAPTFYSWKKEQRPIISLVDKYFKKEDLEEFLATGRIQKLDNLKLINSTSRQIVSEFFYDKQKNKFKNKEFLEIIFPSYIDYVNKYVENRKKVYEEMSSKKEKEELQNYLDSIYSEFNKRGLTEFIVKTELDIDKTSALLEIAGLSDLEIHLLVSSHKEFLDSIDNNLNDFMKISQAATAIKEIERKILEIKNKS